MRLKLGVVVPVSYLFDWQKELIEKLESEQNVELELIKSTDKNVNPKSNKYIRFIKLLYKKLIDRQAFIKNALGKSDLNNIFKQSTISNLSVSIDNHILGPNIVEENIAEPYDYIIVLSLSVINSELLKSTKKGILVLSEGLYLTNYDEELVGFWENYSENSLNTFSIFLLDNKTRNYYKIDESFSSNRTLSLLDSRNGYLWKGVDMLMRIIKRLEHKEISLGNEAIQNKLFENKANFQSLPNSRQLTYFLISKLFSKVKALFLDRVSNDKWHILIRKGNNLLTQSELHEYKLIQSPKGTFWADPFVHEKDGQINVFVEEFVDANARAHISVLKFNEQLELIDSTPIIETEYHLSYPFIFELNTDLYMVPESSENRTVSLYKCTNYPSEWQFIRNIMSDIAAFDSTIIEYNGKWWLFANVVKQAGVSDWDELYIYYTNDLINGEWLPHAMNPVVSHTESARPAGKIFVHENRLIRPSQDSSKRYGYALNFFEIISLDETSYKESLIEKILPSFQNNNLAIHTFNHSDNYSVIDGLFRKFEF